MKLFNDDLYIDCNDLINEANILYSVLKNNKYYNLHKEDIFYIETMNNYINNYNQFRISFINKYIQDLKDYLKSN